MLNSALINEWNIDENIIHLNHAAVAPWPSRTREALHQFITENITIGSKQYQTWVETEMNLRRQLRELINAPSIDDIALLKSTSEGLSVVAYGLDWQPGDNVVISDQEFPSNRIVWESLGPRYGVEVIVAPLGGAESPEEAVINCCNERTKLISISSVQYASGLRIKLETLGAFCRQNNICFCVDAIQSLGALAFDVQAVQADFVVADAHKWMLGPEGIALFYASESLRERLHLNQFGWHMVERVGEFDALEWQPAKSARRFECGSPNMLGIQAFNASISLLLEVGMSTVESELLQRVQALHSYLDANNGFEILSQKTADRRSGIVTFRPKHGDCDTLYAALQNAGVLCAQRGGGIRFSPHYYTPLDKLKRAVELAAK